MTDVAQTNSPDLVSPSASGGSHGTASTARPATESAASRQPYGREWGMLEAVADGSQTQLAYLDPQFNFVWVNAAYVAGSGHTREELIGRNHFDLFPNAENLAIFTRVRDTGAPIHFEERPFEYVDQPERGTTYWDWSLVPDRDSDGHVRGLMFSLHEVTERRQLEEQLARSRQLEEQLRELNQYLEQRVAERTAQAQALASALNSAEQHERQRVSQVLHDDLQQLLYSQLMRLEMLGRLISAPQGEPADLLRQVDDITRLVQRAVHVTRTLVTEFRPLVFEADELQLALQWLAKRTHIAYGLRVHLSVGEACCLEDPEALALLLQVVRELLFNVVKHAGVGEARLSLWQEDARMMVRVEDDGKGFDVETVRARQAAQGGMVLFSVAERLELFGGHLEIDSAPGRGTRVTVSLTAQGAPLP